MADRSTPLIVDALRRAAAEPAGVPLFSSRSRPGLFGSTVAGKQAAARCRELALLRSVDPETQGKATHDTFVLSDQGLAYLLNESSPKRVLEDLVSVLQTRQVQLDELVAVVRLAQGDLANLRSTTEKVLQRVVQPSNGYHLTALGTNGCGDWTVAVRGHLQRRPSTTADCPLPELFHACRQAETTLTIGQFHDGLRRLHELEQVYLHPWTGPLHEIPEPPYALLVGHEIAYYASLR